MPAYPADISPRIVKQADGTFVVSGEDLVAMMQWIEQLAQRERALVDCVKSGQAK